MTRDEYILAYHEALTECSVVIGSEVENAHALTSEEELRHYITSMKAGNIRDYADYQLSHVDKWVATQARGDIHALQDTYIKLATARAELVKIKKIEALREAFTSGQ